MDSRSIKPSLIICPIVCDFSELLLEWLSILSLHTWSLMTSYSCSNFSWGKRTYLMLFLYFLKCLAPVGHTSSNTGLITGWEVLTGPPVYTSKNRELLFIFVLFDHSLPLVLPNYRKNSVWTRKLVLWIHISFVGQWSSCMWHDFCWHITYSLFSFFFSPKSERDYFHSSHKSWRVAVVSLWPGESFHHLQLQFSLL